MSKNITHIISDNLIISETVSKIIGQNKIITQPTLALGFEDEVDGKILPHLPLLFEGRNSCLHNISRPTMICEQRLLPLKDNTISLVIIKTNLEFSLHHHEILREIWRVLDNEGHIILIARAARRFLVRDHSLCIESGYSHAVIKKMLSDQLFEVKSVQRCLYSFSFVRRYYPRIVPFTEKALHLLTPMMGSVIICLAQKRVIHPIASSLIDKQKITEPKLIIT